MTATEKAALERRIYDRCIVRVGQLEAEKATLEERIDELCKENEQLRQQVASIIDRSFRTADKMDCLNTENAKLRELLQDIAICASGRYCHGCPHQYDGCDRDERLRAAGIEVD